ncbi:helix-turn-helix domain-containing protein [Parvibium lacunae]|uniref:XRE family transcriptional regulator n=1 Tax=Parvibium lacunae TaxID=1888893 RepID=A0A368L0P6_9BURK|nr:helix-turn-helix domain-containing protein [Parvibium lacunae]RCS56871.1 XRE family transcriptional regulator [Parvibium lacunae]
MSKSSPSLSILPPEAASALVQLGEHLALARVRRKESQRVWAQRMGISVPTLVRMERGDASVSMGVYATALWMMGQSAALSDLAAPEQDRGALESDVRAAKRTRAVRSQASLAARLAQGSVAKQGNTPKSPKQVKP